MITDVLYWNCAITNPPQKPGFYIVAHRKDWDTEYRVSALALVNFGTHENPSYFWSKGRHWYSGRIEWWMPFPDAPKII